MLWTNFICAKNWLYFREENSTGASVLWTSLRYAKIGLQIRGNPTLSKSRGAQTLRPMVGPL